MKTKAIKELPFSLFIFDLDGTALGGHEPYEQFPPEFAEFLDELDARGIKWGTATTWAVDKQLKLIRSSGVKSDPVLLTGSTGRTAFSVIGDRMFPISEYINKIAGLDSCLKKKHGKVIQDIINKLKSDNLVESISYNRFGHHIISFKAADGKEKQIKQVLQILVDKKIYYYFNPGKLKKNSLLPEYMNKGRAVKFIQKKANIHPCKTLIAGDASNDLHMLDPKIAKYMICPNNANIRIKKIVRDNNGIVATKNYSYGVVEAVNKLL